MIVVILTQDPWQHCEVPLLIQANVRHTKRQLDHGHAGYARIAAKSCSSGDSRDAMHDGMLAKEDDFAGCTDRETRGARRRLGLLRAQLTTGKFHLVFDRHADKRALF